MDLHIIDYSIEYYAASGPGEIPSERDGKFIQIRGGGVEYILLSPKELCRYHANIAERFFAEKGIAGAYNEKGDIYISGNEEWRIVGGGVWRLSEPLKELNLMGASQAYGRFDPEGLRERILMLPEMADYRVRITSC